MKDHELRELINAVTAAARTYAQTQQLREQIAQLITPAIATAKKDLEVARGQYQGACDIIKRLECESEFRRGMVEGKDVIIEMREAQITELQRENAEYLPVINMLILCGEEPCRTVESYPHKLRALIDDYIMIKRENAQLTKQVFCDHYWQFYDNKLDLNPGEERTFYFVCEKCGAKKPMMEEA